MLKVKQLSIAGKVNRLIENWQRYRKQRLFINGSASYWAPFTSDVPQGSVLGPVLLIIYINDFDIGLKIIAKFADNTKIENSIISDRDRESLQDDLCKISAWSDWGKCLTTLRNAKFFQWEQEIQNSKTK